MELGPHVLPGVKVQSRCSDQQWAKSRAHWVSREGGHRASQVCGACTPRLPPGLDSCASLPALSPVPSCHPSPHSATWTSPLTWTSRASCVSCPAPPTTGCAETAPGFSHPSPAGPAEAQRLWHFLGGFRTPLPLLFSEGSYRGLGPGWEGWGEGTL